MPSKLKLTGISLLAAFAAACAGTPGNQQQVATDSRGADVAVASNGSSSAATNTHTVSAVNPTLLKEGYRVARRKGQVVYCRDEAVTGTRFTTSVCLTEDDMKRQQDQISELEHRSITTTPASSCAGPCVGK